MDVETKRKPNRPACRRSATPLVAVALALSVLAGCASTGAPSARPGGIGGGGGAVEDRANEAPRYAAVIDAGSSGSRIYLYQWRPAATEGGLPWIEPAPYPRAPGSAAWEFKTEPGLSSFADDPSGVRAVLEPLLDFAAERIGDAPGSGERFPLYLKATAGLRLLPEADQRRLLAAARSALEEGPFEVAGVEVIGGREEGLYGWLSVNYALGYLRRGGPFPSIGALDLGGASTQITFVPLDLPRSGATALAIGDTTYRLYAHSYLGLGQDQGLATYATPACYPVGYPIPAGDTGTGDYDACRADLLAALEGACEAPPCSWMGVYQPPLYGDFFAFSAFTYALDFFRIGPTLALDRLDEAGRSYCAREWSEIVRTHAEHAGDPYLPQRCFSAAWIVSLLHDGYGFPMDSRSITVAPAIQGNELGWALGALVYELGATAAD